jgi:hypothetical protein
MLYADWLKTPGAAANAPTGDTANPEAAAFFAMLSLIAIAAIIRKKPKSRT